ncbi:hypothetical protein QJQ45_017859 [Haematococcus lacustris]|nr:hypothetical protein QJQ45_017859 [Haematococcus lacustris]
MAELRPTTLTYACLPHACLPMCAGASAMQRARSWAQDVLAHWQDTSRRWGSLRHTSNIALLAAVYARELGPDVIASPASLAATRRANRCWVRSQLSYMAGSNPQKQSFVIGYLPSWVDAVPQRPHHRSASCSPDYSVPCNGNNQNSPDPSPSVLQGALVGGPSSDDSYADVRGDYIRNEVALDYNAAFTGALASLVDTGLRLNQAGCSWDAYCAVMQSGGQGPGAGESVHMSALTHVMRHEAMGGLW